MEELGLVGDLAVVATAAVAGGVLARLLKLPTIIGYLAAGILIGPNTPGPTGDIEEVQTIADLGVALLMFTLGIEFSVRELRDYRGFALVGGAGATAVLVLLGTSAALALGLSTREAVVIGMAASISSSMVGLRLLEGRGQIGARPGRLAIVASLVQDMSVVLMLALIPAIAGDEGDVPADLALGVLKAAALLGGLLLIGDRILPYVLTRVAASRSRELFLLTVVALALVTASVSAEAGLSLALGAFLAGLIISESEYAHRIVAEVFPLREVFAVVFFVAIGMLLDPDVFTERPDVILLLVALGTFLRILLIGGAAALFRFPLRFSLTAAVALATVGEFSFVIASQATEEGILGEDLNDAIIASVLLTMVLASLLFLVHERVLEWARAAPAIGPPLRPRTEAHLPEEARLVNHAIIVGYTPAGREVASALAMRGFRFAVIDEDPVTFRELSGAGIPVILGNPEVPLILKQAGIDRAWVLAVALLDPRWNLWQRRHVN
jgi:K+:H+ antiporter